MQPFFSIITRNAPGRADLLKRCEDTVRAQTFRDVEHLILYDLKGVGVGQAQKMLHTASPRGEYVLVLDDDDFLSDDTALECLHRQLSETLPDAAVVRVQHGQLGIMPWRWGEMPECGQITVSNLVVSNGAWYLTRGNFGTHYAGDFDWIASVFAYYKPLWLNVDLVTVKRMRHGQAERVTA